MLVSCLVQSGPAVSSPVISSPVISRQVLLRSPSIRGVVLSSHVESSRFQCCHIKRCLVGSISYPTIAWRHLPAPNSAYTADTAPRGTPASLSWFLLRLSRNTVAERRDIRSRFASRAPSRARFARSAAVTAETRVAELGHSFFAPVQTTFPSTTIDRRSRFPLSVIVSTPADSV
jgi:hypothetical protein